MGTAISKALVAAPLVSTLISCTVQTRGVEVMPSQADGAAFFAQNCVSCHGSDGGGAGIAANGLSRSPTDLTTLSMENGGTFPAARALSYIYGDPQNSHLARVMPQFGPEMAEDLVPVEIDGVLTPTPRELAGLLVYLEGIQK
ncbi:MAG: c-type cytochrome [Paracoccaceae bacterium]|nr:c-type cytochrome [Paracoccaceae bacterium]